MRLLNLVQQDHGVRFTPHGLGQLAALIVSNIARRRTDQPADSMPLLVFAHVDTGHHVLIIEQELRQCLGQFGLADAGRTHEQEGADRPLLVRQAGPVAPDRIRHRLDGRILADHPFVQGFFHPQQFLLLAFQHPLDRDAGPFGHDFCNIFRGNRFCDNRILNLGLLGRQVVDPFAELGHPAVTQLCDLAVITGALGRLRLDLVILQLLAGLLQVVQDSFLLIPPLHQGIPLGAEIGELLLNLLELQAHALAFDGLLLDLQLADLGIEVVDRFRHRIHFQPELGCRLVDQVDRLVRQETVGDVAVRQIDGRNQSVILNTHPMVVFIFFLQSTQDRNRFRGRRLIDHHHLETTLQGLVGLKILLVLIQGRRTDGPQFAAGQGRLQDIGRIHGAGGLSGTHQGVDFVDEEDDLALAVNDFLDDALEPFLKFALVFRTGDQGTHIQRIDEFVLQVFRDLAIDDLLGDALGDRGLAHTRLADQDRVVLGPAAQDLEHPADLVVTTDDRIQLPFGSQFVEVSGKFL